jgi:hypothetical protein
MDTPDNDVALEFLRKFHPNGPWVLTAINPDRKGIETRTFTVEQEAYLRQWLETNNGNRNIYFLVNRPIRPLTKKPAREDIAAVEWLHVDIDPREKHNIDEERSRILRVLQQDRPADVPAPTVITFSGGGYQAFWRLEQPIVIDGSLEKAEDAKRYNQRLESELGGDRCHNIDRIMRLPGTVNIPDAKKTEKGRTRTLAKLVEFDETRVYPLAEFKPAQPAHADRTYAAGKPGQYGGNINISGNVARVGNLAELDQYKVPERVKEIIAQGNIAEEPKERDNSRSAWLFDAVCGLVRCEVPDEMIFSIITDPGFGISASVLDKGSQAVAYAFRHIESAKDHTEDPILAELNAQHFVIENDGGRFRIAEWIKDPVTGREQMSFQTVEDFKHRYMNQLVEIEGPKGPAYKKAGEYWLAHPRRRSFRGVTFKPGGEPVVDGHMNLWRGFGVQQAPGDWSLMQTHIREVLADGDDKLAVYITRWAAWAVQNPEKPAEVALVFQGGQGTGKGTFGRAMTHIFGQHGLQVSSASQVSGRFNAHLRDVCLLFADEAIHADDKAARSTLKALLTEPSLTVEGKGKDIVQARNAVKVIMASNEAWVVPTDYDDRRFAVMRVSDKRSGDRAYFKALNEQLESGGLAAMLYELLAMELEGWHPRDDLPQTQARSEQQALSTAGFEGVFLDCLQVGEIPFLGSQGDSRIIGTVEMQAYAEARLGKGQVTLNAVTKLFTGLGFKRARGRPRGFILPDLPIARAAWDRVKFQVDWDEATEWNEIVAHKPAEKPPF